MLAGENFGDHPVSVCPVIGAFLRCYNDAIDDERRQDLYAYAAKVVGSRSSRDVRQARLDRLERWVAERRRGRRISSLVARLRTSTSSGTLEHLGSDAVRVIPRHTDGTHAEVLALIDELLALGDRHLQHHPAAAAARHFEAGQGRPQVA